MIRAGIRGGPLVNSILTWSPRNLGANIQAWNGFDHSNVEYLLGNPDLRVLVVAYALPNATVITTGNSSTDYFTYRKERGFPDGEIHPEAIVSQRNGQRISPFFSCLSVSPKSRNFAFRCRKHQRLTKQDGMYWISPSLSPSICQPKTNG